MKNRTRKLIAAAVSALTALTCIPSWGASAADGDILVTGFEDGDVSAFSKRGDDDTSVIKASAEDPHSGDQCMSVTGRDQGWNGPSVSLAALGCEPGVRYIASAWVRAKWYNSCKISMQYTDEGGEPHYNNLIAATSQGEWVQLGPIKFSFSEDMTDVQIYIESDDNADLAVDDFSITKAPVYEIEKDIPSLKEVYHDYFKIGCAVTNAELAPTSTKNLIRKHFNSVTLGNELKPENMLDAKATLAAYEETGDNTKVVVKLGGDARSILNFCRDEKIPVRGHVLVWHSQTPGWFFKDNFTLKGEWVDKETMTKRMESYIKGVFEILAKEYPTVNFYAWDVVNEAWTDGGVPREGGTYDENRESSGWVKVWGDNSFIETAFELARKYAPKGCKLYYNDFNEYIQAKTEAIVKMATDLKAKGLIDGIGCQSHLNVTNNKQPDPFPSARTYEWGLEQYAKLGLDIQITELDATWDKSVSNGEKLQEQYYSDIMDAIVKYKDNISAVVFWGTTDDQSWRSDREPLLFREDYTAKPCFFSIVDGIEYTTTEPNRTTESQTTETTKAAGKRKPGDVDESGSVTVGDAVLLARFLSNDPTAASDTTEQGLSNADCDGVSGVSSDDLTAILRYLARLGELK